MAIYGQVRTLAFTRPGYKAWIDIESSTRCYDDIAFYKGIFYAVDVHGEVFACCSDELFACRIADNQKVGTTAVAPCPKGTHDVIKKYIVESSGGLLLVSRMRGGRLYSYEDEDQEEAIDDDPYVTIGFTVLKLKRCTQAGSKYKYKYVKVHSLGDRALFVGDNSSVSLSASSFNGCKVNCIYFTDDNFEFYGANGGGYDMGVFSVEDGEYKHHYEGESLSYFSTPLWYI